MSDQSSDRRREPRFSIDSQAVLRRRDGADVFPAVVLNISSGGLLVGLNASPFAVADTVIFEIVLPYATEQAFASWGIGRVTRIDESKVAIEINSGIFRSEDTHE